MINFKTTKLLGSGFEGFVYLADYNDKKCVAKVYKTDEFMSGMFIDELLINKKIKELLNNKYEDSVFMKLVAYMHDVDCSCSSFEIKSKFSKMDKEYLTSLNNKKSCNIIVYEPVLEKSLDDWILDDSIKKTKQNVKHVMSRVFEGIYILETNNIQHNDLHGQNIMYRKVNNKYDWRIIDYGSMLMNAEGINYSATRFLMHMSINRTIIWENLKKYDCRFDGPDMMLRKIKEDDKIYKQLCKYIPKQIINYINNPSVENGKKVVVHVMSDDRVIHYAEHVKKNVVELLITLLQPDWYFDNLASKTYDGKTLLSSKKIQNIKNKFIIHPCEDVMLYVVKNMYNKNVLQKALQMLKK